MLYHSPVSLSRSVQMSRCLKKVHLFVLKSSAAYTRHRSPAPGFNLTSFAPNVTVRFRTHAEYMLSYLTLYHSPPLTWEHLGLPPVLRIPGISYGLLGRLLRVLLCQTMFPQ